MVDQVVLIRGFFRGTYHWGMFDSMLENSLKNKEVISFDVPGNGYLCSYDSPMTIEAMVENIREQRINKGKVNVLAISMGGMIGLKWAEMYPDEIKKLICMNTTSRGVSPFYQRLLPCNYIKLISLLFASSYARERSIYQMVSNKRINERLVSDWAYFGCLFPMRKSNFFRQLIAASKYKASKPRCNVFFISSRKDKLISFKASCALAKVWKVPIIINEEDGHDIALDNPVWLCDVVKNIIDD